MDSERTKRTPRFQRTGNLPPDSREALRLMAARMVIKGRSREEIASHMRDHYEVEDIEELLEEVGARS